MATYSIHSDSQGFFVVLQSGNRRRERLRRVGSLLPVESPFRFRGTPAEQVALDILAHHFKCGDHAILRGKTPAWSWHRKFCQDVLGPLFASPNERRVVSTQGIRDFITYQQRPVRRPSLFEQEDTWGKAS